jgi:hypothetical protein
VLTDLRQPTPHPPTNSRNRRTRNLINLISTGKAIWKLDDPLELRAERDARAAAAAEAAKKKAGNALAARQRDVEKFEKLAALPEPEVGGGG